MRLEPFINGVPGDFDEAIMADILVEFHEHCSVGN
jgi:hypothetical protein